MSTLTDRITEVLAQADYEMNDWSGCNGSRWEVIPEGVRIAQRRRWAHVAERVAAALPETRRQYVAAYRADNGNVIALSSPNTMQKYAEVDAEKMRSPEDETEVFVACRDLPAWSAVEADNQPQEGQ